MIAVVTDFGIGSPYVGQMEAVLYRETAGRVPVVRLFSDAPTFDPRAAAYLLAAYPAEFPTGTVFLGVVDPGVGTERRAAALRADGRWFVGPDNGLFNVIARRAADLQWWDIDWRPERLSASFHGRDLFAPVAAALALGCPVPGVAVPATTRVDSGWPEDLAAVVYIDHFGNAMTGLRAARVDPGCTLRVAGRELPPRRTFAEAAIGEPFWYANANGLVEVAVNQGHAAALLGLSLGSPVEPCPVAPTSVSTPQSHT